MEILPASKDQYGVSPTISRKRGVVGTFQITMLGIGIVIAGHNAFWNSGLHIGCYDFLACALCMGLGFFIAALCLSEMTNALPFSGGMYGSIRLTYGNHLGFLVGTSEILQNLVYTTYLLIWFSNGMSDVIFGTQVYSLVIAVVFFLVAIPLHCVGGKVYWRFATTICALALVLLLAYIGTAASSANFDHYINGDHHEVALSASKRLTRALTNFPSTSWFFVGMEMIPLVTADASEPRKTVPRGIMISVCFMIAMSVVLILCVSANSPGPEAVAMENMPLKFGYMQHFHLSEVHAAAISIPALFISALNFIYIYGRQMKAMADSNLLPRFLTWTCGSHHSPYVSQLIGSGIVFVFMAISFATDFKFIHCMSNVSILISFFIYTFILLSYLRYKKFYQSRRKEKHFVCTSNRYVTYVGIAIFSLAIVALVGFNADGIVVVSLFLFFQLLMSICYKVWVFQRQSFSEEEKNSLFAAYVMKANRLTKERVFRRKQSQVAALTSSPSTSSLKSISDCKINLADTANGKNRSTRSLFSSPSNQCIVDSPRMIGGRSRSKWFLRLDSLLGKSGNDLTKRNDLSINTTKTLSIMSAATASFHDHSRHLHCDAYDEENDSDPELEDDLEAAHIDRHAVVMAFKELEASFRGNSQNNSLRKVTSPQQESSSFRKFAGLLLKSNAVSPTGAELSAQPSFRSLGGLSTTSEPEAVCDYMEDKQLNLVDLETGRVDDSSMDSYEAPDNNNKQDEVSVAELGGSSSCSSLGQSSPQDHSPVAAPRSMVSSLLTLLTTATTVQAHSNDITTTGVLSPSHGNGGSSNSVRYFSHNASASNSTRLPNTNNNNINSSYHQS